MSEKQLTLQERREVSEVGRSNSILEVIREAAKNPEIDVAKMQGLMDLYERAEKRQAEQVFAGAMNEAQMAVSPISADANNPQTRSKYASYMALDRALRPIYSKHGFALSFDTADCALESYVRVVCYVSHRDGHTRTYHVDVPADGKGAKGGDVMTKTHAVGAAMTYGQRYLLKFIFNIAVGDDDDGNKAGDTNARINEEQLAKVRDLLEKSGADIEKFCAYFKIDALPDLKAKDLDRAIAAINLRDKKAGGK